MKKYGKSDYIGLRALRDNTDAIVDAALEALHQCATTKKSWSEEQLSYDTDDENV